MGAARPNHRVAGQAGSGSPPSSKRRRLAGRRSRLLSSHRCCRAVRHRARRANGRASHLPATTRRAANLTVDVPARGPPRRSRDRDGPCAVVGGWPAIWQDRGRSLRKLLVLSTENCVEKTGPQPTSATPAPTTTLANRRSPALPGFLASTCPQVRSPGRRGTCRCSCARPSRLLT